ncbi:hypothetical protein TIFTF001_006264 [Ficus carica]|uniref:Uncharacterized protein n=1 Tax=Ficus carica TaxID=3494 RepID=A0AA88CZJ7_FICCA|nr:hypothetical protein TIFTF001_006264 [Ficus carica]
MKKSPVYPKHETNDNNGGDEYDPHADFSLFLEEAKRSERRAEFEVISSAVSEEDGKRKPHQEEKKKKKKKKAWKVFLMPWWKGDKESKPLTKQETNFSHVSNVKKRGFASGPVYYSSGKERDGGPPRRPTSGPLSSLFNATRKADTEIPYMCLNKLDTPRGGAQTCGPVYLVT